MRVYPLSDYKLKELKMAHLRENHFKSPHDALYQKNRAYFDSQKPSGIEMEDFITQEWEQLNQDFRHLYIRVYRNSKKELYQAAEQLLIEPKIPPIPFFLFAKHKKLDPQNMVSIFEQYNKLSKEEKDQYEYQHSKLMEQYDEDRQTWKNRYQTFFSNSNTTPVEVMESYKEQKKEHQQKLKEEEKKLRSMTNKEVIMKMKQVQKNRYQDSQKKIERKEKEFISNFLGLSQHLAQFIDQ